MKKYEKNLLFYTTKSLPISGIIVSAGALLYFVIYQNNYTCAAVLYSFIPLIGTVLIALPFWILVYRIKKGNSHW
jgi:hypothetical protein